MVDGDRPVTTGWTYCQSPYGVGDWLWKWLTLTPINHKIVRNMDFDSILWMNDGEIRWYAGGGAYVPTD